MLRDRIIRLKAYGLLGIWINSDGNDSFNAGSIFGYRDNDWQIIIKYSGICSWRYTAKKYGFRL